MVVDIRPGPTGPRGGLESLIVGAPASRRARATLGRNALLDVLLTPDQAEMGRRNRLSNFAFYFLAAAGGSGASVVAAILAGWALLSVMIGRFRWRLERSDLPIVVSSLAFFLVLAASDIVNGPLDEAFASVAALLPFVIPLALVPRMRLSGFFDTLPPAFLGAAIGGIVLVPIVVTEFWFISPRVQGFSGNPGPMSVTALLCAGWAVLHFRHSQSRWHLLLVLAGAIGASIAVILTGMRGAWPLLPICLAIAFFAQRREFAAVWREASLRFRATVLGLLAVILGCVVIVVIPPIVDRMDQMWTELGLIAANADTPTSLNFRKEMYSAASRAIEARPWFGYGSENHWEAVTPYLNRATFEGVTFTHFHNVFLTVGVDAGLVGILALLAVVAAPLLTAWQARRTIGGGRRLGAALILIVAFLGAGMTNIMFFHDILDAVWVFSVSLIAASVPATTGYGAVSGERD